MVAAGKLGHPVRFRIELLLKEDRQHVPQLDFGFHGDRRPENWPAMSTPTSSLQAESSRRNTGPR